MNQAEIFCQIDIITGDVYLLQLDIPFNNIDDISEQPEPDYGDV